MDTAKTGEAALWEAQRASNIRLDFGAKVWGSGSGVLRSCLADFIPLSRSGLCPPR